MSRRSDLSYQQAVRRISRREEQFWEGCRPHCRSSLFHRDSVCEGQFCKGCRPFLRSSIREREDVEFARMYSELSWPKLRPKTPAGRFSGHRPLPLSENPPSPGKSRALPPPSAGSPATVSGRPAASHGERPPVQRAKSPPRVRKQHQNQTTYWQRRRSA